MVRGIPLLKNKAFETNGVFTPEGLLREARRQKELPEAKVPEICVLDPDGDILRNLQERNLARLDPSWACYHTDLYRFALDGVELGIVGCAVGGAYAVLLAEEFFACGCGLLISITSAGQIKALERPPYYVLIEKALRDEGTSYHYLPPDDYVDADPALAAIARDGLAADGLRVERGPVWTTDAPFRETKEAIETHRAAGILAVEMEAASLYAFAKAKGKPVLCFAHVTNQMAGFEGDFEKGEGNGSVASLEIIASVARAWKNKP